MAVRYLVCIGGEARKHITQKGEGGEKKERKDIFFSSSDDDSDVSGISIGGTDVQRLSLTYSERSKRRC